MYTTIRGKYKNGQVTLSEMPPTDIDTTEVLITFASVSKDGGLKKGNKPKLKRKAGCGKGMLAFISPDFDEPLEDFKEYMQ